MERGQIVNRARARQIIDFRVLKYERGITPTDIDGLIDFNNKFFVIIEIKYLDTPLPTGQRLAIERIVDNLINVSEGRYAIALIASHDVGDTNKDIDCSKCIVTEVRIDGRWRKAFPNKTVKMAIDFYKKKYE